jgi:DNA processing protein
VAGDANLLQRRCLAIVGTRRATHRGLAVARALGCSLAEAGWVIVSGLAHGVDAAAHRGALASRGATVAVIGTGIDRCFPAQHATLQDEIAATGCVVTEFPAGAPPNRWHFPRRNRLIAGLCEGVIVVEAPRRSGALLTAMLALEMNREVFAVPGPIDSQMSRGCHHLIKEGANLIESPADVHQVLTPPAVPESAKHAVIGGQWQPQPVAGSAARWIFDRLDLTGVAQDTLLQRWPGTRSAWLEGLLALEMAGLIRRLPGGLLARRAPR